LELARGRRADHAQDLELGRPCRCDFSREERAVSTLRPTPDDHPASRACPFDLLRGLDDIEHAAPFARPDQVRMNTGRPKALVVRRNTDVPCCHEHRRDVEEIVIAGAVALRGCTGVRDPRGTVRPRHHVIACLGRWPRGCRDHPRHRDRRIVDCPGHVEHPPRSAALRKRLDFFGRNQGTWNARR
jgi:hypothetical protein